MILGGRAIGVFLKVQAADWKTREWTPAAPDSGGAGPGSARLVRNTVEFAPVRGYHAGHGAGVMERDSLPEHWQMEETLPAGTSGGAPGGTSAGSAGIAVPAGRFLKTFVAPAAVPTTRVPNTLTAWRFAEVPQAEPIYSLRWAWTGRIQRGEASGMRTETSAGLARPRCEAGQAHAWTETAAWRLAGGRLEEAAGRQWIWRFRHRPQSRFPARGSIDARGWSTGQGFAGMESPQGPRGSESIWLAWQSSDFREGLPWGPCPTPSLAFGRPPSSAPGLALGAKPTPSAESSGPEPAALLLPADGRYFEGSVPGSPPFVWRCYRELWRPVRVDLFFRKLGLRVGAAPSSRMLPAESWANVSLVGTAGALRPDAAGLTGKPGRAASLAVVHRVAAEAALPLPWPTGTRVEGWRVRDALDDTPPVWPVPMGELRDQGWFWPETSFRPLPWRRAQMALPAAVDLDYRWTLSLVGPGARGWTHPVWNWRHSSGAALLAQRAVLEHASLRSPCWLEDERQSGIRAPLAAAGGADWRQGRRSWRLSSAGKAIPAASRRTVEPLDWGGGPPAAPVWPQWAAQWACAPWKRDALAESPPGISRRRIQAGSGYVDRLRLPLLVCRFPQANDWSSAGKSSANAPLFPFARL